LCILFEPFSDFPSPAAPTRGVMKADGVFVPEGAPADFDLPTSRARK